MTTRFEKAVAFAPELHRDHRRKGTSIPYISHLLAVAGLVLDRGGRVRVAVPWSLQRAGDVVPGWPRGSRRRDLGLVTPERYLP